MKSKITHKFLYSLVFVSALIPVSVFAQSPTPLITDITQVEGALTNFVSWMYRIFWVIAVGFVIWSAFLFLGAGDDAEKVSKAKKMIIYTVIAAAIVLLANGIDVIVTNLLKP